ncbi:hypothetical protein L345_13350, partial [Ophiophagus hannah]
LPKEFGLNSSLCSSLNLQAEAGIVPIKSHAQIAHIKLLAHKSFQPRQIPDFLANIYWCRLKPLRILPQCIDSSQRIYQSNVSEMWLSKMTSARLHHTLIHRSYKISVPLAHYLYNVVPSPPLSTKKSFILARCNVLHSGLLEGRFYNIS